jgi:hypothetical protein
MVKDEAIILKIYGTPNSLFVCSVSAIIVRPLVRFRFLPAWL